MKRNIWIVTIAVLFGIFFIFPVWAEESSQTQTPTKIFPGPSKGTGIMGGGGMVKGKGTVYGKKPGVMRSDRYVHGRKTGRVGYRMGMDMGSGLMGPFHGWMKGFMAHQSLFDLSADQTNKIEGLLSEHLKNAIRGQAEMRVLQVDLIQKLQKDPVEVKAAEDLLKKISDEQTRLQMEGVQLYSQILLLLNDSQKAKVREIIGSPFCIHWESMMPVGGEIGTSSAEPVEEREGSPETESTETSDN